jgi:1-acyl-sn-glycerol-3-phosphate acyltransferase
MQRLLKIIFFAVIVKPIVFVILGLNTKGRDRLPVSGPAVIVANHNSHLDTIVLMSLFPLKNIHHIRPVAAADYFLRNKVISWFSRTFIDIIPLDRSGQADRDALFSTCHQALDNNDILIIFPEGSRGSPEKLSTLRKGVYYLLEDRPDTPIIPVVMHGLGAALPRGEGLLVPFNCDVVIGNPISRGDSSRALVNKLTETFTALLDQCITRH